MASSLLPIPPHVELSGEAGIILTIAGVTATTLFAINQYWKNKLQQRKDRTAPPPKRAARPRVTKANLLALMEAVEPVIHASGASAVVAIDAAAQRAIMRAKMGDKKALEQATLPLAKVMDVINQRITEGEAKVYAEQGITEADALEAIRFYGADPAVKAAQAILTAAYPLYIPPSDILRLQSAIAFADIQAHREAVKEAHAKKVRLNSPEYAEIAARKIQEVGGKDSPAGGDPLAAPVLEREGYGGVGGRNATLWTHIVSYAFLQENLLGSIATGGNPFQKSFWKVLERQKRAMRRLGLDVS